ncbi:MAG: hypothetical protein JO323_24110 [Acidobacteriia bacterium]|nr:hypothetical protein [Terriglobia bacterium]
MNLHESGEWVEIRCPESERSSGPEENDRVRRQLEIFADYGKIGGRRRDFDSILYFPANGSSIRASEFKIRWNPVPNMGKISLQLQTSRGQMLWEEGGVEAGSGSLDSKAARQAVIEYVSKGGSSRLQLKFIFVSGRQMGVEFSILSPHLEEMVDQDLTSASEHEKGIFLHLARSYILSAYQMYNDVAEEYDAAVREAPESLDLLLADLRAQMQVGNAARAKHLQAVLARTENGRAQ